MPSGDVVHDGALPPVPLWRFYAYFLRLGAAGFGGPIALAGFMQRDLVEDRRWISRQDYLDGLALAQLAPGPLAAQLAMYLGYVRAGVVGATIVSRLLHPAVVSHGVGDFGCLRPLRRPGVDGGACSTASAPRSSASSLAPRTN